MPATHNMTGTHMVTNTSAMPGLPTGVLYRDDFTDPNSGWPNALKFDNYYIGYHEPDHYHVEVHTPRDRAMVTAPKQHFGDFTVEVHALVEPNNTAKDGDFRYGLVLRRAGSRFYAFTVSPRTGTWAVLKNSPSGLTELAKGTSDAIHGLTADDMLRVDARGPDLAFQINGQPLGRASDPDYTDGEVGFYVETFDSTRVHIHFGAFTVREVARDFLPAGVLYQDDFTDPASGWQNALAFDNYYIGYHEPNHYHVEVHAAHDHAVVAAPKQHFADFTMEARVLVEPNNTAKEGDFRYGLMFRRSGSQYYALAVSPRTGAWAALKSTPAGLSELATGTSDAVHGLTSDDVLRVDARGPDFAFSLNGQPLGRASDPEYADGEVGFYVETFDSPRVHMHFGTFTVREVDAAALAPNPQCTVVTEGVNLREGPGTDYAVTGTARKDAVLNALGRSADANWINVRVADGQPEVWVSAAPVYVSCNVPVNDMPVRNP
jgi:hypothetical protein